MTKLPMLSADDKLTEIRRLYFATTKQSIVEDLARAVQLLTSMQTEEERERAAVYMDGLAQMRSDWGRERGDKPGGYNRATRPKPGGAGRPGGSGRKSGKPHATGTSATAAPSRRDRTSKPRKV